MNCSKQTTACKGPLSKHHVLPRAFYGTKQNRSTVTLCQYHHEKVETIYMATESYVHDLPFGQRAKLSRETYERIMTLFLKDSKIIYLETA